MTSSYTSRAADLPFSQKLFVSYDTNKFLRTSSKDVEKISHFLSGSAFGHLTINFSIYKLVHAGVNI